MKNFANSKNQKKVKGSFKKSATQMTEYQRARAANQKRKKKSGNYDGIVG